MAKESILILAQLDHLTGEDLGWALEALSMPGVRNRNLIPTLTKKGRMGYLLLVDVEPYAEADVSRFLMEGLNTHGYHRIQTRHVYERTVMKEVRLVIQKGEKTLEDKARLKRKVEQETGPYFLESDDLFSLQRRVHEELGVNISPLDLRHRIEVQAEKHQRDILHISL